MARQHLTEIAENSKASQGAEELAWLLERVAKIKPQVIVEIGVHLGHSLKTWQDAFQPKRMIGIDHETNETIENYINSKELKCNFLIADSHDPMTKEAVEVYLDDEPIDFLFIDGDHMYDGVKKDFELYAPLVRSGGIIAFDDMDLFDNPSVEVYEFWQELISTINKINGHNYSYDSFHQDSNGIGVLYV